MRLRRFLGFRDGDDIVPEAASLPHLGAALSVVALLAENPDTGIRLSHLVAPGVIALSVASVAWLVSRFVTADAHRRGLLSLGFVVVILFFGYVASGVEWTMSRVLPLGTRMSTAIALLAALGVGVWVARTRWSLATATRFFSVTLGLLLAALGVQGARGLVGAPPVDQTPPPAPSASQELTASTDPDIYFILLDAYTGPGSLAELYDLDISDFVRDLEGMGFVVPTHSRANYVSTVVSLSSMLDMDYLDDIAALEVPPRQRLRAALSRLHDNTLIRTLRERGYRMVFFRSSFQPLNSGPWADVQVPARLATSFEGVWIEGTLFPVLAEGVCSLVGCRVLPMAARAEGPAVHEWRFAELANLDTSGQPTFVFAHVLLPHEPFIFESDCWHTRPWNPSRVDPSNEREVRSRYAGQVECLNRMVLRLARALVVERDPAPVVIFQSDHGFGRFGSRGPPPLEEASPDRVDERLDIFAAYHVPEVDRAAIPDSVTPINAMRGIFGHYLDMDLPPLPARSYWSPLEDPLRFEPVS